ncbi:MAG TPA: FRG domain-containing protein [Cyclobacteriaceae bacterium]|nr:FRG domain-containing protein [Cyclobacteriaceae bacterium]
MAKRDISNLDLKIKLTNEYLNNGGVEQIFDAELLQDLMNVKFDTNGKADPDTVSSRVNSFMLALLHSHLSPPFFSPEQVSEYQSTLQKSNNFDQENIDTPEQFDVIYEKYKNQTGYIFRGQREAKWRLYNSLQRNWLTKQLFKAESYEQLVLKIVEVGRSRHLETMKTLLAAQHIDIENDIAVLGYLQHHGCPTPLMDWTFRFQCALFFALDGLTPNPNTVEIQNYCSVYYIDQKHVEKGSMRYLITTSLESVEKPMLKELIAKIAKDEITRKKMEESFGERKLFDRTKLTGSGLISHMTKIEHVINTPILYFSDDDVESGIVFSLKNSKNIQNQAGVFIWNHDPSKPIEIVGDEQYRKANEISGDQEINYRFCRCLNIHKQLEGHIRSRLEADGITREYIYPTRDVSTWDAFENSIAGQNAPKT